MVVQNEEGGKRRRANWYDRPPATDAERASVQKDIECRFPDLRLLEARRQQLALIRREATELQHRGFSDRQLFDLKRDAWKLSGEIEDLLAAGTFPSR